MNLRKRNIMFTAALFMLVQMFAQGPNNTEPIISRLMERKAVL